MSKTILFMVLALLCIYTSCSKLEHQERSHNESEAHPHPHDDDGLEPLSYTLYSDKTELFVEFRPLIKGKISKFAAHFTKLGDRFEAITEGSVSVKLTGQKGQVIAEANSPSSPGIFRLAIEPNKVGVYNLVFDIKTTEYTDRIIIKNVTVLEDEKLVSNQQESASENEITYLKEQAWKVEFANEAIQAQDFAEIIKTTGQILGAQGDEAMVTAKSSGIITFSNKKLIGSTVNKGESLFSISDKDFTNEDNLSTRYQIAKADFEQTKENYERAQKLIVDQLISEKELQDRKAKLDKAESLFKLLSNRFNSTGQKVKAPIKGFIKNLMVKEGEYVEMGQSLASISQNQKLILRAEVPQKQFSKLAEIVSANFKTAYDERIYDTESLNGRLISYGKHTSNNTFYIPIHFEIDNQGELIEGAFIETFLKTRTIQNALTIPFSALLEEQGKYFVYIQTSGESFEKREVKLGASDGKRVEVLSGVQANERVVTKGAYQIKLSTMSGTMPAHGHSH